MPGDGRAVALQQEFRLRLQQEFPGYHQHRALDAQVRLHRQLRDAEQAPDDLDARKEERQARLRSSLTVRVIDLSARQLDPARNDVDGLPCEDQMRKRDAVVKGGPAEEAELRVDDNEPGKKAP